MIPAGGIVGAVGASAVSGLLAFPGAIAGMYGGYKLCGKRKPMNIGKKLGNIGGGGDKYEDYFDPVDNMMKRRKI